jgi:Flp pilus assembly pilin Flp
MRPSDYAILLAIAAFLTVALVAPVGRAISASFEHSAAVIAQGGNHG